MEIDLIYLITFTLVILQTIVGVGVLVVGTPFFLLLNFNIIEIMNLLLPISITTSLLNYIYLKSNKKKFKINLDKDIKKNFLFIFLPGIFLGLFLISKYFDYINFEILVSIIIFASLIIKWKFEKKINLLPLYFKRLILIMISVIHGLTNSGGTLLTIFFSAFEKNGKSKSRYSITFYYLILALVQYSVFLFIFYDQITLSYSYQILLITMISIFVGTIIVKHISENIFKMIIEILALFSAFFLLINNLYNN